MGTGDQRVVGEAFVAGGVIDLEELVAGDGMATKGQIARGVAPLRQADGRFPPLAVVVDQREQRDRHAGDGDGKPGEVVENRFWFRIQKPKPVQCAQAQTLVFQRRGAFSSLAFMAAVPMSPV